MDEVVVEMHTRSGLLDADRGVDDHPRGGRRRRRSRSSRSTSPSPAPCRCAATRSAPTAASSPPTCPRSRSTCTTGRSTCRRIKELARRWYPASLDRPPRKAERPPGPRRHPREPRRAALLPRAPSASRPRRRRSRPRRRDARSRPDGRGLTTCQQPAPEGQPADAPQAGARAGDRRDHRGRPGGPAPPAARPTSPGSGTSTATPSRTSGASPSSTPASPVRRSWDALPAPSGGRRLPAAPRPHRVSSPTRTPITSAAPTALVEEAARRGPDLRQCSAAGPTCSTSTRRRLEALDPADATEGDPCSTPSPRRRGGDGRDFPGFKAFLDPCAAPSPTAASKRPRG